MTESVAVVASCSTRIVTGDVRRSVHEGVADDVGDHLPQPILVAVDDDWRSVELDVDRPPGRRGAGVGGGVARQHRQVDRSHVEWTPLVEPGERQHVVDEAADARRLLLGATHRVVERRRVAEPPWRYSSA